MDVIEIETMAIQAAYGVKNKTLEKIIINLQRFFVRTNMSSFKIDTDLKNLKPNHNYMHW